MAWLARARSSGPGRAPTSGKKTPRPAWRSPAKGTRKLPRHGGLSSPSIFSSTPALPPGGAGPSVTASRSS
eukprot:10332031-Heterocapsa_arctica.AAC.1